ncbi:MAG: LysR family transcriptional regulator [Lachnospiraceae bacterium]
MLDLRIQTFLAVCHCMNFTKAAEELNLTQPAVSKHIRYLEDFYGIKLFHYENRKLTLTEQGIFLRNAMESMYHDSLQVKDAIASLKKREQIKMGATLSIGGYYLPERLTVFLEKHPDMDISVTIASTEELLQKLDHGELAYILCEGNFNKQDYDYKLIKRSHLSIFCGAGYDTKGITDIKSLFSHRIFLRERGSGTREIFEHYLNENGYSISSFFSCCEMNNPELILKLLSDGMGISVLYHDVGEQMLAEGRLKEISLRDFQLEHELNAIWNKGSIYGAHYGKLVGELIDEKV